MRDRARPGRRPVYPRIPLNALLAFMISTFLGVGVIFLSESLDHTLRDPDMIQRSCRPKCSALCPLKSVAGHLPGVDSQGKRREFFGNSEGGANTYEEAVRTLRDSILLPSGTNPPRTLLTDFRHAREGRPQLPCIWLSSTASRSVRP